MAERIKASTIQKVTSPDATHIASRRVAKITTMLIGIPTRRTSIWVIQIDIGLRGKSDMFLDPTAASSQLLASPPEVT